MLYDADKLLMPSMRLVASLPATHSPLHPLSSPPLLLSPLPDHVAFVPFSDPRRETPTCHSAL